MAYRNGEDRGQLILFPESIDEYVPSDHPVRAYDAFVDKLDFMELGIAVDDNKVGNSEYHPRHMLKLLIYGCSYGIRSSRKLERENYNNVTFMWLMRRLTPDHKTIAEFRRRNKEALRKTLKLCARVCVELDLIDGNILFVDGTKIKANASRNKNYTEEWYRKHKEGIEKRIEQVLEECERIDEKESGQGSLVKMKKDLASAARIKEAIEEALERIEQEGPKTKNGKERTVNLTDNESALMRSGQGTQAGYNMQSVVDDKHGLIVNTDAVKDASDVNQFAEQIGQAEGVLWKRCEIACADAGYADTEELKKIEGRGTKVIVPSQRQALHGEEQEFSKSKFRYDKEHDCYTCPEGQKLIRRRKLGEGKGTVYQIEDAIICHGCKHYGVCTKSIEGRNITRMMAEEDKERIEKVYEEPESQKVYARRKGRAEHPFGHLKRNLGITHFLLRGRKGAQAEAAIGSVCFNIVRMITILGGVSGFIEKIAELKG
jgi:transposase